jgi:cytochrome c-type biogenesis protein CcmF
MVTHLGVVVMALGIVTSTSLTSRHEVALASGRTTVVAGHRVGFFGTVSTHSDLLDQTYLKVIVDGHEVRPAITTYHGTHGNTVGTPAIDSNLLRDVYVTFDAVGGNGTASGAQVQQGLPAGSVVLGVTIEPLLSWLWIGGIMIGLGAAFSFFRGKE